MPLKTIEYTIKSDSSWGKIKLPEEPFEKVEKLLVDISKPISGVDLLNFVYEHPYLINPEMFGLANGLAVAAPYSKEALELKEKLLLSVCVSYIDFSYDNGIKSIKEKAQMKEDELNQEYNNIVEPIIKMMEKFKLKDNMGKN